MVFCDLISDTTPARFVSPAQTNSPPTHETNKRARRPPRGRTFSPSQRTNPFSFPTPNKQKRICTTSGNLSTILIVRIICSYSKAIRTSIYTTISKSFRHTCTTKPSEEPTKPLTAFTQNVCRLTEIDFLAQGDRQNNTEIEGGKRGSPEHA